MLSKKSMGGGFGAMCLGAASSQTSGLQGSVGPVICVPQCLFNRGLCIFKQHQLLHTVAVLAPFALLNPGKCISTLSY